jgi:hypothetical protein
MKRVALLLGCALLLLPASPALAKKKHKPKKLGPVVTATATGNTVSSLGNVSTATATCPSGKQAVGGGFSVPLSPSKALFVTSSFRSAPNAWTVAARESKGSAAATAFAYCRNANRSITDVTASGNVPSGGAQVGSASASCPAGTQLISGGFEVINGASGNYAVPTSSLAINTSPSWLVQAVNNTTGAHPFTVHAYCMVGIPAPKFVNATSSPTLAQFASSSLSSPSCPKPKKGKKKKKRRRSPHSCSPLGASRARPPCRSPSSATVGSTGRTGSSQAPTAQAPRDRFTSIARESASSRYFAPSFAAASRMFLTVASGAFRP